MGQSSSSSEQEVSPEMREAQSLAASTGALSSLEKAFSLLSDSQTKSIPIHSLQKCFSLTFESLGSDQDMVFKEAPPLFSHLGSTIVDLFFVADKDGVNWIEFLRGYTKCCARTVASTSFNNLFRIFSIACSKAGLLVNLQVEMCDDDCKINGSLSSHDLLILLWVCWIFSWDSRTFKLNSGKSKGKCSLPDISHLVLSAIEACVEDGPDLNFWDSDVSELDIKLPAAKIHLWALKNIPNLADCFVQFVHARLCHLTTHEDTLEAPCSSACESSSAISETNLLTRGRAWAISLTLRGPIHAEISKACFPSDLDETKENIIYRSSVHGKGLNRFWSNVEGYNGPLLVLIAACEDKSSTRRWIIGALTDQGFENRDLFYGTSGSLYALNPVFHALSSTGREKNYVYSHLHPTGKVYDAHPKPVGVGFGGNTGNERIFMDEDFSRITVRHHAVDKTYQHGPLLPNQGFLPVEASVLEVEVWGLGGRNALKIQAFYKKREQLFTEQRRKIDLKTFSNWDDSPEKMMMDMMSNPNAVEREDR
ncbi:hypothetical protein OROHE_023498 [Orobanche hederae]